MPVIQLYRHGATIGTPPTKNTHDRGKRQAVEGWTSKSARANTTFLQSVELADLWGYGFAFTLTLKDCPETHEEWQTLRTNFIKRLRRKGLIRLHWVTEWQRRGVPHLHGVAYFDDWVFSPEELKRTWCSLAEKYTASHWSQDVKPISDSLGWLKYLAKHASRGAMHYQRSSENIPKGWQKTGRIWGKVGDWPIVEPLRIELDNDGRDRYRRIIRSYLISVARTPVRGKIMTRSITYARIMLKSNNQTKSNVAGLRTWIPEKLTLEILDYLKKSGFRVEM